MGENDILSNPNLNNLSKHAIKQIKREEREKERMQREEAKARSRVSKNVFKYGIIAAVVIGIVVGIVTFTKDGISGNSVKEKPYTSGPVHWHANLEVITCGVYREMPKPVGTGDAHLGQPLLHTHKDGLIHIEGRIYREEDIMLGKYMNNIGVDFADDKILDYVNGNGCNDGKQNMLRMKVNGEENFELSRYVIQDGDKIEIIYE